MNLEDKVILERYKKTDYPVRYTDGGRVERYMWYGAKGNIPNKVSIPYYVYQYLTTTNCLKNGELVVAKNNEEVEELLDAVPDRELLEANSITRDEIVKALKGTVKDMDKKFSNITSQSTKQLILDTAKEIGITNSNKQKYIKEMLGTEVSIEELFV